MIHNRVRRGRFGPFGLLVLALAQLVCPAGRAEALPDGEQGLLRLLEGKGYRVEQQTLARPATTRAAP